MLKLCDHGQLCLKCGTKSNRFLLELYNNLQKNHFGEGSQICEVAKYLKFYNSSSFPYTFRNECAIEPCLHFKTIYKK